MGVKAPLHLCSPGCGPGYVCVDKLRHSSSRQRYGTDVLVNWLAFVVVFRMAVPVRACEHLGRFIGFEAPVTGFVLARLLLVSESR